MSGCCEWSPSSPCQNICLVRNQCPPSPSCPRPIRTEVYLQPDPLCPPTCPMACPPKVMIMTFPTKPQPPPPPPPPQYCITVKRIPCQPPPPPLPPVSSPCRPIWISCAGNNPCAMKKC